jgi:hypothetical protein
MAVTFILTRDWRHDHARLRRDLRELNDDVKYGVKARWLDRRVFHRDRWDLRSVLAIPSLPIAVSTADDLWPR